MVDGRRPRSGHVEYEREASFDRANAHDVDHASDLDALSCVSRMGHEDLVGENANLLSENGLPRLQYVLALEALEVGAALEGNPVVWKSSFTLRGARSNLDDRQVLVDFVARHHDPRSPLGLLAPSRSRRFTPQNHSALDLMHGAPSANVRCSQHRTRGERRRWSGAHPSRFARLNSSSSKRKSAGGGV